MKLFQNPTNSPTLPYDIITLIIDIVGEDMDILKELALVSHSFHEICNKYLFATIELRAAIPIRNHASSKKGFVKLIESRPDIAKYIRSLSYYLEKNDLSQSPQSSPQPSPQSSQRSSPQSSPQSLPQSSPQSSPPPFGQFNPNLSNGDDHLADNDHLLSSILPNFLLTIPRLNYLEIYAFCRDWTMIDSSLTSALLHLMHLPTMNHIELSCIDNFPLSGLISSVNLRRFEITQIEVDDSPAIVYQSEIMPQIRELLISESFNTTKQLLMAKMENGLPAFKFIGLLKLTLGLHLVEDRLVFQYFVQNARFLMHLNLTVGTIETLVGIHYVLAFRARTLKVLELTLYLHSGGPVRFPLGGLCKELEAMAGRNILEVLSFEVYVEPGDSVDFIGSIMQDLDKVLVEPPRGWPALKRVTLKISCPTRVTEEEANKFDDALQSLPDEYLSRLLDHESIDFYYHTDIRSDPDPF